MPTALNSLAAMQAKLPSVRVPLEGRAYEILIAPKLVSNAGRIIGQRVGKGLCGVVTDENVARHHLPELEAALSAEGRLKGRIVLPAGESTKSFSRLAPLCEGLLEMGLERGDIVVAFGGGVVGDLAGFAASILRRGVRLVQIPTTLLAQVDSSVGGKTGINTPQGKNLIGTFYQPSLVLADTSVLETLPERQLRAGYAEVVKYGLLGNAQFFGWLEDNWDGVLKLDVAPLTKAIETSVKAKAEIVVADERESGQRALLNLGHTFGHALEAWTGYSDRLLHGEGISVGMCLAFRLSHTLGLCEQDDVDRVVSHLKAVGLPTTLGEVPDKKLTEPQQLMDLMAQDKKVQDGRIAYVLVRGIGQAFVAGDVDPGAVQSFLARELAS